MLKGQRVEWMINVKGIVTILFVTFFQWLELTTSKGSVNGTSKQMCFWLEETYWLVTGVEWSAACCAHAGNSNAHRSVEINTEMTILLSTRPAMSIHCVLWSLETKFKIHNTPFPCDSDLWKARRVSERENAIKTGTFIWDYWTRVRAN